MGRRDALARCKIPAEDYHPGPRWETVWRRLSNFAQQHEVDPFDLIVAQFELGIRGRLFEPNQLLTAGAVKTCKKCEKELAGRLANHLAIQVQSLRLACLELRHRLPAASREDLVRTALSIDSTVYCMGPLFRHCAALAEGIADIASGFQASAAYMYWPRRRHYDDAWGPLIPVDLKASAEHLYWACVEARLRLVNDGDES
jgi:hypothetical protein